MRIVLCSDTWLPQVNGVSRTLHRLMAHLLDRGHEVALVTPELGESGAEGDGARVHIRRPGRPVPLYPDLLVTLPLGRGSARALDEFEPHVVHCATESVLGWSVRRWALARGIPLVTSYHTNFAEYAGEYGLGRLKGVAWSLLRRFHSPARATLCPSTPTLEELSERGFHPRTRVWSRGVDANRFHPGRRSGAWQPSPRSGNGPGGKQGSRWGWSW
ncbi:MAG: hypothetical protein EA352_03600 [Gemmatimonadales bacterium]|nr:MAG: hypothetical protein EA352_03600 [Gemmatimonadales bacterium]